MNGKLILTGAALAAFVHAQSVGSAFREVTLAPEEIAIELVLSTPVTTLSEQAVSLLAPLSLSAQELRGVGALRESPDENKLGWHFFWVRPYISLDDTLKRIVHLQKQLGEQGATLSYEFFLRPSPKTFEATRRKVLAELLNEAKRNAGSSSGKVRSVMFEPRPETIDAGRASSMFGRASGALQYHFSLVAVFENE